MADRTASQVTNLVEYTVSELAFALKRTVEDAYGLVKLRGEISGYKGPHSSGHCYFTLKDENACIEAVIWRSTFARLKFKPEAGLEVVAKGRVTTYPDRSKYQIVIDELEPAGVGALMALLEQRKKMLAAEGLFHEARKKPLPFLPRIVGVVTSPTGAVIRDILHRLSDRFPSHVLVWPVRVQGETCAVEVAAAITGFNALVIGAAIPRPDLIIVARGGGSLEDLWGFNEEIVARAVAELRDPPHLCGRARDRLDDHRSRRRLARADPDRGGRACRSRPCRSPHHGHRLWITRREHLASRASSAARTFPCRHARPAAQGKHSRSSPPALRHRERTAEARASRQCASPSQLARARRDPAQAACGCPRDAARPRAPRAP